MPNKGLTLLTTSEASAMVGVGEKTFVRYADELGIVPDRTIGRSYMWALADVERVVEWLDEDDEDEE